LSEAIPKGSFLWIFVEGSGNQKKTKKKSLYSFRSSVSAIKLGVIVLPLSPRGFLLFAEIEVWQHPRQGVSFPCEPELRWGAYRL
jgi:hypothetical protein